MDCSELTIIVLFDLNKAFDYVDPKVILKTMFELGFSLNTITRFHSYLSQRSQSIRDENSVPLEFLETSSGVLQGSVLGPILFLIVINLVTRRIAYCKYGLFADDKYIYYHSLVSNLQNAVNLVTKDAQAIFDWAGEHGLAVNLNKTKAMIIGTNIKLKQVD